MRRISRRDFLTTGVALGALPLVRCAPPPGGGAADRIFRHGVASGDPLSDRVVLWSRVTAEGRDAVDVTWTVATDRTLSRIVSRGETRTGAARDHTVKVDVGGLEPGRTYYYRFDALGDRSVIGRTRTLPATGLVHARIAVVSCANFPFGYFNAYGAIAARPDLDLVVHLGDYYYEYANNSYGNRPEGDGTRFGRIPVPDRETIALADYRARHAQYKTDPDLQAIHRQHPFVVTWDDHEFANNAWRGGAQNHDSTEGDWYVRRNAAMRAYFEWMPIREGDALGPRIYRTIRLGGLADLIMLDTRLVGRDQQVDRREVALIEEANRSILGAGQEDWLGGELVESVRAGTPWQVLGQQVIFAPQVAAHEASANADSWDGYRACRDRVFDMVEAAGVRNLAVLTGDAHSNWAWDLPRRPFDGYDPATGRGSLGVELVGTSVTSPSTLGTGPDGEAFLRRIRDSRPNLHYVDGRYRGYYILDLTPERLQADYYTMRTIEDRSRDETFARGFAAEAGRMHLEPVSSPAPAKDAPEPAP
ncbi:MAG: alkaline phosphatase [Vicinamibacterales bacterium]